MKNTKAKNPFNPNQAKNKNPESDSSDLNNTRGNAHLLHSFKTPSSKARVQSSNCTEMGSRWGTLSSVREVMLEMDTCKLRAKLFGWGRAGAHRHEGRACSADGQVQCPGFLLSSDSGSARQSGSSLIHRSMLQSFL